MSAPVVPEAYRNALLALLPGKNGCAQPRTVQRHLLALETAGLARFSWRGGWHLTPSGRALVRAEARS